MKKKTLAFLSVLALLGPNLGQAAPLTAAAPGKAAKASAGTSTNVAWVATGCVVVAGLATVALVSLSNTQGAHSHSH